MSETRSALGSGVLEEEDVYDEALEAVILAEMEEDPFGWNLRSDEEIDD